MTRVTPTFAESTLAAHLADHLRAEGHQVSNLRVEDRPDIRFVLNGVPTACELVQIPPSSVLQYVHARFKQLEGRGAKAVRVVWPQEPHYWAQEAIESKQPKLAAYRRNAGVHDVSLLIHTPIEERNDWVQTKDEVIRSLIRMGVQRARHSFQSIYFWSRHTGIELLAPTITPWPELTADLRKGYPTHGFVIAGSMFRTTEEGGVPALFDYGEVLPAVIVVPPRSPEFRAHKPRFENPPVRMKILARATSAELTFEQVMNSKLPASDA